jgi:hypothetical protein
VLRSPSDDLLGSTNIELQKKFSKPISMAELISLGSVACSNEIPQSLLLSIGDPNRREVSAPEQTRKLLGRDDRSSLDPPSSRE